MERIDFLLDEKQKRYMEQIREHEGEYRRKYMIFTYGCQMNCNDSEKLSGMLEAMGFVRTEESDEADLFLINTCCVREHAESKVYGNVGALCKLKRERPEIIIGVCGCMMQQEGMAKEIKRRFPATNLVFGTHDIKRFPELMARVVLDECSSFEVLKGVGDVVENMPMKRDPGVCGWVSIMYGCDNFCSYCIVPYVRGRERSRKPEDIITEINEACANGIQEITLLGQNVNSYGKGMDTDFPALLKRIAEECAPLKRLRFMTSHPKDLSDALIEVMATTPKVCAQLHLPVQSGSDEILKIMNRKYTSGDYIALTKKIRAAMPDIGLTTDIIVGFPGETDEDFRKTLDLVREVRFDTAFTFKYSKRTGTPAAKMEDQIPPDVKQSRLVQLIEVQKQISDEISASYVGRKEAVLIESLAPRHKHQVSGKTESGHTVIIEGEAELIGSIQQVEITGLNANTLKGSILKEG